MKFLLTGSAWGIHANLVSWLEHAGYMYEQSLLVADNIHFVSESSFDIIVIANENNHLQSMELLHTLRQKQVGAPVLIMDSPVPLIDRVNAFDAGADGYLTWPASPQEFLSYSRAIIRRSRRYAASVIQISENTSLDLDTKQVSVANKKIQLKASEYKLLEVLVLRRGRVLTKEQLFDQLYGINNSKEPCYHSLAVFMCRLRRKIRNRGGLLPVETFRGVGYKLNTYVPKEKAAA